MGKLQYANYESIVDTIYIMGNIALKFHVSLHYKDRNGVRRPIESEYSFYSPKYGEEITNIYRTLNFYVTIDNLRGDAMFEKQSIMILPQDMIYLKSFLNSMVDLSNKSFVKNGNDNYEIEGNEDDKISQVFNNKLMYMAPAVVDKDNVKCPGVRIALVDSGNTTEVTNYQFMGFKYLIDNFDMYGYAINILNYMKPNFGENVISDKNRNINNSPFR